MKKKLSFLLVLVLIISLVFALSSCGETTGTDTDTTVDKESNNETESIEKETATDNKTETDTEDLTDTETESENETETSTESENESDLDTDSETETNTETDTETEGKTETESENVTDVESETESGSGSETDKDSNNESSTNTDGDSDTETNGETDSDTETESDTDTDTENPEHVHTEEIIPAVEPTCTDEGLTEGKKCSECGEILVEQKMVDAKRHTEEILPAIAPTCTQTGLTEGKKCSECGEILVEQEIIKVQHTYENSYTCSLCSYVSAIESAGLEFTFNTTNDTYAVSGIGTCKDTDIVIPYTYEGKAVTSIGKSAFEYCTNLTSITIPNSVTSIGNSAFYYCESLTSINIGDSVTSVGSDAFEKCNSLTSITIPNNVTYIGSNAFRGTALTEINFNAIAMYDLSSDNYVFYNAGSSGEGIKVTIGKDVTKIPAYLFKDAKYITSVTFVEGNVCKRIGNGAFSGCTSLTSVNYLGTIEGWCDIVFDTEDSNPLYWAENLYINGELVTELVIPNTVTEIKDYAFYNFASLTSVTIPDSETSIGSGAFSGCTSLTSIEIPNSVTSIGKYALSYCSSLTYSEYDNAYYLGNLDNPYLVLMEAKNDSITSCTINENTKVIYQSAFSWCTSLKSITIPSSVISIGDDAFDVCTSLTYNEYDNAYYLGNKDNPYVVLMKAKDESITSCTINENTKVIYQSAFFDCDSLTSITIPDSVTSIGDDAFYGCTSLTNVTIGEGVTSIGEAAFSRCTSLTSITIPSSVTNIEDHAFSNCSSFTEINFNAIALDDLSEANFIFSNVGNGKAIKLTIGKKVTKIPAYLFEDISCLISVTFEKGSVCESIGYGAFYCCWNLMSVTFDDPDGWYVTKVKGATIGTDVNLSAMNLKDKYSNYYWYKKNN